MAKGRLPNGQKKDRIRLAVTLLSGGYSYGEAVEVLSQQYRVTARSAVTYISEARQIMLENISMTEEELRAQSFIFYSRQSHDPRNSGGEQIRARMQIDRLMGLVKPVNNFIQQNAQVIQVRETVGSRNQENNAVAVSIDDFRKKKHREVTDEFATKLGEKAKAFDTPLPEESEEPRDDAGAGKSRSRVKLRL